MSLFSSKSRCQRIISLTLVFATWLLGAAGCGVSERVVLSMQGIDCATCGQKSAQRLRTTKGVKAARFHKGRVEIAVRYDPKKQSAETLSQIVQKLGYRVHVGPGKGRYLESAAASEALDVRTVTKPGSQLDIRTLLAKDKVTVVDFFAVWCGPCRKVDEYMLQRLNREQRLAYRRIDIDDWDSAIAKQYLGSAPELPYVLVFDKAGRQVGSLAGLDLPKLGGIIDKALDQ